VSLTRNRGNSLRAHDSPHTEMLGAEPLPRSHARAEARPRRRMHRLSRRPLLATGEL
jgi:hypothetical protein